MTLSTQEKLAKIREVLEKAWYEHEEEVMYATVKMEIKEALTLITELQKELKPNEIDFSKLDAAIKNVGLDNAEESETQLSKRIAKTVIAEIERQRR